jgi:5'-phosphate synthase pdxT subunit
MTKRIAVLALQGAFIEHEKMLHRLGADVFEVRELADWQQPKDGLVIPGGESTVMAKLLVELGLHDAVRNDIVAGLPVFGTCAGLILLSEHVRQHEGEEAAPMAGALSTMDITTCRNAYGRQLGSFATEAELKGIGKVPMTFIRAPYIESVGSKVEVLAKVDDRIVAARQGNQFVTAFHPELTDDTSVHKKFLEMV